MREQDEEKPRMIARLGYKPKDAEKGHDAFVAVIYVWPSKFGASWSLNKNFTSEDWATLYEDIRDRRVWLEMRLGGMDWWNSRKKKDDEDNDTPRQSSYRRTDTSHESQQQTTMDRMVEDDDIPF